MAQTAGQVSRFFDINSLMRERDRIKELRSKVININAPSQRNPKRLADNMYAIKNKVYCYKFNKSVIPERTAREETFEPNVKRRMILEEDLLMENDSQGLMDVETIPTNSLILLSDLEVVSPVPPDLILEPCTSADHLGNASVKNFEFDPSWKPSVPGPVSSTEKDNDDDIQILEPAPQNFQASSGHFDKYKTCFKRRGDLRMKDAVDRGEEDGSLDHPRIKCVATFLRNLRYQNNLQHWTKLKEQFCLQPLENDSENDPPEISSGRILLPKNLPSDFNHDLKSTHFQSSHFQSSLFQSTNFQALNFPR